MHVTIDGLRRDAGHAAWNADGAARWLNEAAAHSGLTVIAGPVAEEHDGVVHGWVMIAESHISCHLDIERGHAHLDMFSCKDFDADEFVHLSVRTFGLMAIQTTMLPRELPA